MLDREPQMHIILGLGLSAHIRRLVIAQMFAKGLGPYADHQMRTVQVIQKLVQKPQPIGPQRPPPHRKINLFGVANLGQHVLDFVTAIQNPWFNRHRKQRQMRKDQIGQLDHSVGFGGIGTCASRSCRAPNFQRPSVLYVLFNLLRVCSGRKLDKFLPLVLE